VLTGDDGPREYRRDDAGASRATPLHFAYRTCGARADLEEKRISGTGIEAVRYLFGLDLLRPTEKVHQMAMKPTRWMWRGTTSVSTLSLHRKERGMVYDLKATRRRQNGTS